MKSKQTLMILVAVLLSLSACAGGQSQTELYDPTPASIDPTPNELIVVEEQDLSNLPLDLFLERAFNLILERDPEWLVELGMDELGPEEPVLTNFSSEYIAESNKLYEEILSYLYEYDFEDLGPSDQISYQVFEWYLLEEIEGYQFINYEYLVNPLSVRSWPQLSVMFFTDTHPLVTQADAEAYLARIHLLDEKIDQMINRMKINEQAGLIPPRLVIEYGQADLPNYFGRTANYSPLRTTFQSKIELIEDLDAETRDLLDEELRIALNEEVFPALDRLNEYLTQLQQIAPEAYGLDQYQDGEDYYQMVLRKFTTTDLTPEEVHNLGLSELDRITAEMKGSFTELGYSAEQTIPSLYQQVIQESGTLHGDSIRVEYERILEAADQGLDEYFDLRPEQALEVVGGEVGAFYSPGALDGSRPGQFYARTTGTEAIYKMYTVAYHEGIPGHHYQISLAQEADIPLFRNLLVFDGYAEGWALYAEYLASELGWYAENPYGDLGRLQYEALRACRMVVDTGIHTQGWSFDQSVDFIVSNTGISRGFAEFEVMRYISYPGQAPAYLIGKIEIMQLREMAREALGDDFDIREFHNIVLENGSMPLSILEQVINGWIETTLSG